MSGNDDQFLNDVLQCRKQLTLPGIYIKLIVQDFVATFYCTGHSMQELASYAPIKVLPTSPCGQMRDQTRGLD